MIVKKKIIILILISAFFRSLNLYSQNLSPNNIYQNIERDLEKLDEEIKKEKNKPDPKKEMELKWKKVPYVKEYGIEIYTEDKTFIKKIVTEKTIHKEMLTPGKYNIRLQSIDRFERAGPWSPYIAITLTKPKENINLTKRIQERKQKQKRYEKILEQRKNLEKSKNSSNQYFCTHFQISTQGGMIYDELDIDFKQKFAWSMNLSCDMHTYFPWIAGIQTGIWSMKNDFQDNLFLFHVAPFIGLALEYRKFRFTTPIGYGYARVDLYYNYFEYNDNTPYFFTGFMMQYFFLESLSIIGTIQYTIMYGKDSTDKFWQPYIGFEYRFY